MQKIIALYFSACFLNILLLKEIDQTSHHGKLLQMYTLDISFMVSQKMCHAQICHNTDIVLFSCKAYQTFYSWYFKLIISRTKNYFPHVKLTKRFIFPN